MSPITVLVADDHAIVREGLTTLLSAQSDIQVVGTASTGREALAQINTLQPRVAILDILMPEMDGIETARRIHAHHPETLIVILSMHSGAQHVFSALEAGARGYLLKESAGKEIVEAVRAVSAGRRFLSPRVAEIVAEGLSGRGTTKPLEALSTREREVIKLVADGHTSAEIGRLLNLSPKTVDSYRSRLMQKLQIADLAGLIKFAIQNGLTTLE